MSAKYCHHHQKTMQNADKHRKLSPVTALRLSVVKPSDNCRVSVLVFGTR
jgi:hypothetical protein